MNALGAQGWGRGREWRDCPAPPPAIFESSVPLGFMVWGQVLGKRGKRLTRIMTAEGCRYSLVFVTNNMGFWAEEREIPPRRPGQGACQWI